MRERREALAETDDFLELDGERTELMDRARDVIFEAAIFRPES
jgi:hypothetical protein